MAHEPGRSLQSLQYPNDNAIFESGSSEAIGGFCCKAHAIRSRKTVQGCCIACGPLTPPLFLGVDCISGWQFGPQTRRRIMKDTWLLKEHCIFIWTAISLTMRRRHGVPPHMAWCALSSFCLVSRRCKCGAILNTGSPSKQESVRRSRLGCPAAFGP